MKLIPFLIATIASFTCFAVDIIHPVRIKEDSYGRATNNWIGSAYVEYSTNACGLSKDGRHYSVEFKSEIVTNSAVRIGNGGWCYVSAENRYINYGEVPYPKSHEFDEFFTVSSNNIALLIVDGHTNRVELARSAIGTIQRTTKETFSMVTNSIVTERFIEPLAVGSMITNIYIRSK